MATHLDTPFWFYQRSQDWWCDDDLREDEIDWILEKENNQTSLINLDPTSGGWCIRAGNTITLAELCHYAKKSLTCYDT